MAGEIIGELIAGVAEIGIEAASNSNNKKNGIGCLIMTILLILICVGVYCTLLISTRLCLNIIVQYLSHYYIQSCIFKLLTRYQCQGLRTYVLCCVGLLPLIAMRATA